MNLTELSNKMGLMGADEILATISHDWFFDSSNCWKVYFSYGSGAGNCILLIYSNERLTNVSFQLTGAFPSCIFVYSSLPSLCSFVFHFMFRAYLEKKPKYKQFLDVNEILWPKWNLGKKEKMLHIREHNQNKPNTCSGFHSSLKGVTAMLL